MRFFFEVFMALLAKAPWALLPLSTTLLLTPTELADTTLALAFVGVVTVFASKWAEVAASAANEKGPRLVSAAVAAAAPILVASGLYGRNGLNCVELAVFITALDNAAINPILRFSRKGFIPRGRERCLVNSWASVGTQLTISWGLVLLCNTPSDLAFLAGVIGGVVAGWWVMLPAVTKHLTRPRWEEIAALWYEGVKAGLAEVAVEALMTLVASAGLSVMSADSVAAWGRIKNAATAVGRLVVVTTVAADKVHSGTVTMKFVKRAMWVESLLVPFMAGISALFVAPNDFVLAALFAAAEGLAFCQTQRLVALKAWVRLAQANSMGLAAIALAWVAVGCGVEGGVVVVVVGGMAGSALRVMRCYN